MSELESHQVRKLELEIAELARPLWLKPSFVTPLIAAALSIFVGYVTGWFNVQLTKLENRKFELQQEISLLRQALRQVFMRIALHPSIDKGFKKAPETFAGGKRRGMHAGHGHPELKWAKQRGAACPASLLRSFAGWGVMSCKFR